MKSIKYAFPVKFQSDDLKQHIDVFLVEQSMDQKNGQQDRKGKSNQRKGLFKILPLASTRRLTAINTPNIHSRPEISGILMAAAMYINLVKGYTLVR